MLPTLDKFIADNLNSRFPHTSYVREPGFRSLYVRLWSRVLNNQKHDNVLDIANIQATKPGKGKFTELIKRLHPQLTIYVECVQNPRLEALLIRMGFKKNDGGVANDTIIGFPSYYLLKEKTETCGQCFEFVFKRAKQWLNAGNVESSRFVGVHATVHNPWSNKAFEHAWVEVDELVYDWQTIELKNYSPISKAEFYAKWKPTNIRRYTPEQVLAIAVKYGHYGPWT